LLKEWNFSSQIAIETPLPEYANENIRHNVEFTLHASKEIGSIKIETKKSYTAREILNLAQIKLEGGLKAGSVIGRDNRLTNSFTLLRNDNNFYITQINNKHDKMSIYRLNNKPYAMFECKRVGIEEGMTKGPQTIEKAKQGSYVANAVSALQKVRDKNGTLKGVIFTDGKYPTIDDYHSLLNRIINGPDDNLRNDFILTVGVISNHGNWFTSSNPNKEMKILSQSYDWLLFLTDDGLCEFIKDLLFHPLKKYSDVKKAFIESYSSGSKNNCFTKTHINVDADKELSIYFHENIKKIEKWFNVISPTNKAIEDLRVDLTTLSSKIGKEEGLK
jgi:hypothetical protein